MNYLWSLYLQDDLDKFRNLLANATHASQYGSKIHSGGALNGLGMTGGSPGLGISPRSTAKTRKSSGGVGNVGNSKGVHANITKSDINSRDHVGLTLLHRAASSNSLGFALALLEHPLIDIYLTDYENGWTALHRALYFGNITIARAIMQKDASNGMKAGSLIKIKDNEGNSPFDVFNSSIARRILGHKSRSQDPESSDTEDDGSTQNEDEDGLPTAAAASNQGDELFVFGSNKNFTLGLGDQDDRNHPERVVLKRPDHLIYRFYNEYVQSKTAPEESSKNKDLISPRANHKSVEELPILIRSQPMFIQDLILSKLHSAVITADPESNLYVCGFGPGGRLGTGDEVTRFEYVCIESGGLAGKKVIAVALGLNHSLAVSEEGELFSWGSNGQGQLGYTLPRPSLKDDEPIQLIPRQIFGPLKRELVRGVSASEIHSVAYTSTSLYTWGKNDGQLGLMDSDSRSLEIQTTPRKVAASLFASPIQMVSAINKATICLFENHSVCVFTSYGYSFVKFPLGETFSNYFLEIAAHTTRYEGKTNHITSVTSGGETIAAVSSRGDLFTLNINHKLDSPQLATSTTNPSKIKTALSQPQRIWSLRKGNWDGIRSVDVGENGTVILNTKAGAVWKRVKRTKIKDAHASSLVESKAKDYKFQRIPSLTNITAVRSNTFGGFAAIRKDCDILQSQIKVDDQALWNDISPLLSLRGLEASELKDEDTETPRFWTPALPKEHFQPMKRAVLSSPDLEADVLRHLHNKGSIAREYDVEVSTTTSETKIPVHGFMLAGRSPILQQAWCEYKLNGRYSLPEVLEVELLSNGKANLRFQGIDFITLVNLILYVYDDEVVDVWQFTRHAPRLAFRYRTIRTELMKLAMNLGIHKLEASVRRMVEPEPQLHLDLDLAISNPAFFQDGDAIVELDGDEMQVVHSAFMCQRCPFFQGLFNGRSGGMWLAARRVDESEPVRVDLGHVDPSTFKLVLRHLYADVGVELFDDVKAADLDELYEIVMDVMAVANELMLDRLSQICQEILGRFVTTRNVCHLLNAIAPCACTKFKDAGLEYVCLQLECMLENRLLDDLDEDLLLDLDSVVKSNQLACMPFAKSGKAELLLHERNPGLAEELNEERQRIINDIMFRIHLKDDDNRLSSSYHRARFGSLDDNISSSPSQDKARRRSKAARNEPFSPALHAKDSTVDLMFDMEDEAEICLDNPISTTPKPSDWSTGKSNNTGTSTSARNVSHHAKGVVQDDGYPISSPHSPVVSSPPGSGSPAQKGKTWSTPLSSTKLDMKEIMAQASTSRTSSLSMEFSAQKDKEKVGSAASTHKISQKERKKQQLQALHQGIPQPQIKTPSEGTASSPWQVQAGSKTSLKDLISLDAKNSPLAVPEARHSPVPTISLNVRRTASPDTRFAGQTRNFSTPNTKTTPIPTSSSKSCSNKPDPKSTTPLIPHSKSYKTQPTNAEPALLLSMSDIIGQQRREQDLIKEAVAKRSLQEIQEEQAFQAWWDAESRKAQEEEAERARNLGAAEMEKGKGKGKKGRGGGGQRGGGMKSGGGDGAQRWGDRDRGRGRWRGRGGGGGGGGGQTPVS